MIIFHVLNLEIVKYILKQIFICRVAAENKFKNSLTFSGFSDENRKLSNVKICKF